MEPSGQAELNKSGVRDRSGDVGRDEMLSSQISLVECVLTPRQKKYFDLLQTAIKTRYEYPVGKFHGRGIVTCCGGEKYNTQAWVLFNMIRKLGCVLPIQAWYLGTRERNAAFEQLCAPLGVEFVDARALAQQYPHPRLNGWEVKCYSILQ